MEILITLVVLWLSVAALLWRMGQVKMPFWESVVAFLACLLWPFMVLQIIWKSDYE